MGRQETGFSEHVDVDGVRFRDDAVNRTGSAKKVPGRDWATVLFPVRRHSTHKATSEIATLVTYLRSASPGTVAKSDREVFRAVRSRGKHGGLAVIEELRQSGGLAFVWCFHFSKISKASIVTASRIRFRLRTRTSHWSRQ